MFKSIRTHILSERKISDLNNSDAEAEIIKTIKSGRCFFSNFRRGDARGFRFYIQTDQAEMQMGDIGTTTGGTLHVFLPQKAECKVYRNGKIYHTEMTTKLAIDIPEGIYRIEAKRNQRGWIYSNHIKLING